MTLTLKRKQNEYHKNEHYIANKRIKNGIQNGNWGERFVGNAETIPGLGAVIRAADKKLHPELAREEKANQMKYAAPSSQASTKTSGPTPTELIWAKELKSRGISPVQPVPQPIHSTSTKASQPAKNDPLAGFELTVEDTNSFTAAATFAAACYYPSLLIPFVTIGALMPLYKQMIDQLDLPDEVSSVVRNVLKYINPTYLAYPTVLGRVFTEVTLPNLFNPIGLIKTLWKVSNPGRCIQRIPMTQRQIQRSWKGIIACYQNLGTASTFDVLKNFFVHSVNVTAAIGSHYLLANAAFQTSWYLTTALANKAAPWIGIMSTDPTIHNMNDMCPGSNSFSGWNLIGFKDSFWNIFSWEKSPLWNLMPLPGFYDQTPLFSCGSRDFPSVATAASTAFGYLSSHLGYK